jgi:uroporphyrin-III C-methyltransferase
MTVFLVGAGPGSADLLTLRAAALLREAEVVLYDRLIDPSVMDLINPHAELIDVGKRPGGSHTQEIINELLIAVASNHHVVVRLKGGDPFVFGRGGEEFQALRDVGIHCEVVPGISSALSAPLLAGIPVTHRGLSHGVTVVTGHAMSGARIDFQRLANPEITLVILMGVEHRGEIASELRFGGLDAQTPVAVIERASTSQQRVVRSVLSELGELDVSNPATIVVGPVAALAYTEIVELTQSVGS